MTRTPTARSHRHGRPSVLAIAGAALAAALTGCGLDTFGVSDGRDPSTRGATSIDGATSTTVSDPTGMIDPTTDCNESEWYPDHDGDDFGAETEGVLGCRPAGHSAASTDCDDDNTDVNPSKVEVCNGVDDDCDAAVDEDSELNTACNGCLAVSRSDKILYYCQSMADWPHARDFCGSRGGDLASVRSCVDQLHIQSDLEVLGLATFDWWSGGTDLRSEGSFGWIDGAPFTFTHWQAGEPNNTGDEDCVAIASGENYGWNDTACALPLRFICREDVSPVMDPGC